MELDQLFNFLSGTGGLTALLFISALLLGAFAATSVVSSIRRVGGWIGRIVRAWFTNQKKKQDKGGLVLRFDGGASADFEMIARVADNLGSLLKPRRLEGSMFGPTYLPSQYFRYLLAQDKSATVDGAARLPWSLLQILAAVASYIERAGSDTSDLTVTRRLAERVDLMSPVALDRAPATGVALVMRIDSATPAVRFCFEGWARADVSWVRHIHPSAKIEYADKAVSQSVSLSPTGGPGALLLGPLARAFESMPFDTYLNSCDKYPLGTSEFMKFFCDHQDIMLQVFALEASYGL